MMQTRRFVVVALTALLSAGSALGQTAANARVLDDSEIQKILAERIATYRNGVGIVVGIIEPQGRRVVAYGNFDQGDSRKVDGDTLFEIGSITKVFTSLVLADMARHGEVALTDPIE